MRLEFFCPVRTLIGIGVKLLSVSNSFATRVTFCEKNVTFGMWINTPYYYYLCFGWHKNSLWHKNFHAGQSAKRFLHGRVMAQNQRCETCSKENILKWQRDTLKQITSHTYCKPTETRYLRQISYRTTLWCMCKSRNAQFPSSGNGMPNLEFVASFSKFQRVLAII